MTMMIISRYVGCVIFFFKFKKKENWEKERAKFSDSCSSFSLSLSLSFSFFLFFFLVVDTLLLLTEVVSGILCVSPIFYDPTRPGHTGTTIGIVARLNCPVLPNAQTLDPDRPRVSVMVESQIRTTVIHRGDRYCLRSSHCIGPSRMVVQ